MPAESPARGPSGAASGSVAGVKALNCPNCGAALTIRAFQHTLSVVCAQCLSVLDAKDPNLQILQQFEGRQRVAALIPLGSRGKWRNDPYEVIGFQVRTITDAGAQYSWHEYLLFNPYKGFRYLTVYDGHWNDVKPVSAVPEPASSRGKSAVNLLGRTYVHFQTASAETTFVMGEFPWRVKVGELVACTDYIAPPYILSSETVETETTWSLGEYVDGARIWEAFQLPGRPPRPAGVFANQPSPYAGKLKQLWFLCGILLLLLANLALLFSGFARKEQVFDHQYTFSPGVRDASFVTPSFDLAGRTSDVELSIRTNLRSNWAYFNFALINEATGQAYDFGREVSNYPGEGSPNDDVLIPSVPPGRYYLRVEPEMSSSSSAARNSRMTYELILRRDVPSLAFYWICALLIVAPPVFVTFRAVGFEKSRWQEGGDIAAEPDSESGEDG